MDITNQYDPLRAEVTNAPEQANAETAAQIMGVKAIGEQLGKLQMLSNQDGENSCS